MKTTLLHRRSALFVILVLFPIESITSARGQDLSILENALLYFPARKVEQTPDRIHLKFDDVELETADKVRLSAWWIPNDKARATLIFSHGNAGNIGNRLEKLQIFHHLGLNVLLYDYRGYGKSKGTPCEKGLYADAQAAYDFLINDKHIPADQIISYGESLGGPVASRLAANNKVKALILDSTFSSLEDMAQLRFPLLAWLAKSRFDTLADISKVQVPVLVLHSPNDEVIPYPQGQKLFAAAKLPKEFIQLQGDHNDGFLKSKNKYTQGINRFLATQVVPKKPQETERKQMP